MHIRTRTPEIRAAARARGWYTDSALAAGIGVDQGLVSRYLRGVRPPTEKFIASCLAELGGTRNFDGLFEIVEDDAEEPVEVAV